MRDEDQRRKEQRSSVIFSDQFISLELPYLVRVFLHSLESVTKKKPKQIFPRASFFESNPRLLYFAHSSRKGISTQNSLGRKKRSKIKQSKAKCGNSNTRSKTKHRPKLQELEFLFFPNFHHKKNHPEALK